MVESNNGMSSSTEEQLIELIRNTVLEKPLPDDFHINNAETLYYCAKSQDVAHLAADAVKRNDMIPLDSEVWKKFNRQYLMAHYRVLSLESDLVQIQDAGIDFIPLKGSVIRKLYPQEWMRVSGDIDILVHKEELEKAEQVLVEQLQYKVTNKGGHHDHVEAPNGFHIDLHFTLTECETKASQLLQEVWNWTELVEGTRHEYQMKDPMFYLFHLFHASGHFRLGGCGVRTLLDTWMLNHRVEIDEESRQELITEAGLTAFAEKMERVAENWFSDGQFGTYPEFEEYIFSGGIYGGGQRIAAAQANAGTRTKFIMSRAFLKYESMCYAYPVLRKHKFLLPVCWAHRLVAALVHGKAKVAQNELKTSREQIAQSEKMSKLFKELGLE